MVNFWRHVEPTQQRSGLLSTKPNIGPSVSARWSGPKWHIKKSSSMLGPYTTFHKNFGWENCRIYKSKMFYRRRSTETLSLRRYTRLSHDLCDLHRSSSPNNLYLFSYVHKYVIVTSWRSSGRRTVHGTAGSPYRHPNQRRTRNSRAWS